MGNQNCYFFGFHQIHLAQVSKNAPKPTICWEKKTKSGDIDLDHPT